MKFEDRVKNEEQRLRTLLFDCGVSQERIDLLAPVIENTAWMRAKLDDTRDMVKTTQVVIKYDNGGGQSGLRENPIYKGYESLFKSYMSGMCTLLNYVPRKVLEEQAEEVVKPKTVLDIVRAKHKKEA